MLFSMIMVSCPKQMLIYLTLSLYLLYSEYRISHKRFLISSFSCWHQKIGWCKKRKVFEELKHQDAVKIMQVLSHSLVFKEENRDSKNSLSNETRTGFYILCRELMETCEVNLKFLMWISVSALKEFSSECRSLALCQTIDHRMTVWTSAWSSTVQDCLKVIASRC